MEFIGGCKGPRDYLSQPIVVLMIQLQRLWVELSPRRRWQLFATALSMVGSTAAQMATLVSVMPFLSVLINPQQAWQHPLLQPLINALVLNQPRQLLLPVSLLFAASAIMSGTAKLGTAWLNGRLAAAIGSDFSDIAFARTLAQPYAVHLQRNSSTVIVGLRQVDNIVSGVLSPLLQLMTCAVTLLGTCLTVILLSWQATLIAIMLFGGTYMLIAYRLRLPLKRNGEYLVKLHQQELQILQESLAGIRDVLIDGSKGLHRRRYREETIQIRRLSADNGFMQIAPRFVIEGVGYSCLALAGFILSQRQGSLASSLPILGIFALAAQTFLPNLQQFYACWGSIKASEGPLKNVIQLLDQPVEDFCDQPQVSREWAEQIRFKNLYFSYNTDGPEALSDISFSLFKGERLGVVGTTGSGKSTLIDLLMALLEPTKGSILIDGLKLGGPDWQVNSWRKQLAHVPQNIFLSDSSIYSNIALGQEIDAIDSQRVFQAASQAQLLPLIESLPDGFSTIVGERGLRLSGGQRQRIGIARALYRFCSILILDEATSALDNVTEAQVSDAIQKLDSSLTVVTIAHRLSTVRNCDRLLILDHGRIVGLDSFEALSSENKFFQRLMFGKYC